jgi:hypothetical protein
VSADEIVVAIAGKAERLTLANDLEGHARSRSDNGRSVNPTPGMARREWHDPPQWLRLGHANLSRDARPVIV